MRNLTILSRCRPLSTLCCVAMLSTAMTSCSSGGNKAENRRSSSPKGMMSQDGNGPEIGKSPNAVSVDGQILTQRDASSSARIAQIHIPTGALVLEQKVKIESSYQTDPSDLMSQFKIKKGNVITKTNVATLVTSNVDKNLAKPMTIALDLPPAGKSLLGLVYDQRNFFVVYTVRDADKKIWRRGIMPEKSLTLDENRVLFKSQYMGRYEVFESVAPVETKDQEKAVQKPDFKNPPVSITRVKPLVVKKNEMITIDGKYFTTEAKITIGGKEVTHKKVIDSNLMIAYLPEGVDFGQKTIAITAGENTAKASIIAYVNRGFKYVNADAAAICQGINFVNAAGVWKQGTKRCELKKCKRGNEIDCLTWAEYPALNPYEVLPGNFLDTMTVLNVTGTKHAPAKSKRCERNGQVDCQVEGRYMAVKRSHLSANVIRRGHRIPGFGPSGGFLDGTYPNASAAMPGRISGLGTLTTADFANAVASKYKYHQYWDKDGRAYQFRSQGGINGADIRTGVTIFGVTGTAAITSKEPCTKDNQTGCQAKGNYVAVSNAVLKPENIAYNRTVAGVRGAYPSKAHPMPHSGNVQMLSQGNFDQLITSDENFEYYDSNGARFLANGSGQLKVANIKKGITLFGVTGNLEATVPGVFKPENLRYGQTIARATGTIKANCRNMAKTAKHDFSQAPGRKGLDPFDTITDFQLPSENPWAQSAGRGAVCDDKGWQDVTAGGCKTLSENCMFKDKATGLVWGGHNQEKDKTRGSHGSSYKRCQDGTYGGKSDWRMPSINELMLAHVHGISHIRRKHAKFGTFQVGETVWSDTGAGHQQNGGNRAYYMDLNYGYVLHTSMSDDESNTICVRKDN